MKKVFVLLVVIFMVACAGQLKQTPLRMVDVSEKLGEFDKNPDMNFVSKAKLSYATVDVNKFDEFFKKATAVRGTMVVAKGMIEHEKNLIMNLGKEMGISNLTDINKLVEELKTKKGNIAKEKIEPIKKGLDNMIIVKDLLMGLEGRAKDLISEGTNLVSVAPDELKSDPKKAMSVHGALKESVNNLESAIKEIPELAKSFSEFVDIIKPLVE